MPVHDVEVYYRLTGRLPAGNYAAMEKMEIRPTTADGKLLDVVAEQPGAWLDYNLQVDQPGIYVLNCRVSGEPGRIELLKGAQGIATIEVTQQNWQTIPVALPFAAGRQTIRVRCSRKGQALQWLEFKA